jgi:hypothetical protein
MNSPLRHGRYRLLMAAAASALAVAGAALVLPGPADAATTTGAVVGGQSGRCVDVPNASQTNGTQVQLYDCNNAANQTWTYTSSKQLQVYGNKCLDANGKGTSNGTTVIIWDCNGQTKQQWNLNTNGTITGRQSGLCVDATGVATGNGTTISSGSRAGSSAAR